MTTLLLIGGQVIALEHIVRAEFEDAYPGGEEKYDEDSRQTFITSPRQASLQLTLTSMHLETHEYDYSTFHAVAANENDLVILRGKEAAELWLYLEHVAIDPVEEMAEVARF